MGTMKLTPALVSSFSHALGYLTEKPSSAFWYSDEEPETLVVSETATGAAPLATEVGAEALFDVSADEGEAGEDDPRLNQTMPMIMRMTTMTMMYTVVFLLSS